jgi:hypothetical protein
MNRVRTSQDARVKGGGRLEKLLVDLHEVKPLEEASGPSSCGRAVRVDGAENLDPRERTGRPFWLPAQILAKRPGFRLRDHELHKGGRIQVDHRG